MKKKHTVPSGPEDQGPGHLWRNIGKAVFLLSALTAAWFLLDWLING